MMKCKRPTITRASSASASPATTSSCSIISSSAPSNCCWCRHSCRSNCPTVPSWMHPSTTVATVRCAPVWIAPLPAAMRHHRRHHHLPPRQSSRVSSNATTRLAGSSKWTMRRHRWLPRSWCDVPAPCAAPANAVPHSVASCRRVPVERVALVTQAMDIPMDMPITHMVPIRCRRVCLPRF